MTEEDENVVWDGTVDHGRFICKVVRTSNYTGTLTVVVPEIDDEEILREDVDLSYGAQWGPDVDDVRAWQDKAIEAIDNWIGEKDGS